MGLAAVLITLVILFIIFNDISETSGSLPLKKEKPKTDEESKKK